MTVSVRSAAWPLWQRVIFRFLCVYLALYMAPWSWASRIPGASIVLRPYSAAISRLVEFANAHVFHVAKTLVLPNGSGDTSWAYTQVALFLSIAVGACVAWSVLDRKRPAYPRAAYWLRTFTRYYLAMHALGYGIIKLYALQMPFPALSQLATPLGDFLPMRLSWMFIGYSTPYEIFSGVMETAAGLLLLGRRTVTLGLFTATGAFLNVVMINLAFDVPVKLFASHLLLACVVLLSWDAPRLLRFLVGNTSVDGTALYEPPFSSLRARGFALAAKALFVWFMMITPFLSTRSRARSLAATSGARPFRTGVYDVVRFAVNKDTVPPLLADSIRWRDVIFDNAGAGSVNTTDSIFWQRYRRGYFRYRADTLAKTVVVWKTSTALDSTYLFTMRYDLPDTTRVRLWAPIRKDTIYVELARTARHFQLAERQFHWISEYNR